MSLSVWPVGHFRPVGQYTSVNALINLAKALEYTMHYRSFSPELPETRTFQYTTWTLYDPIQYAVISLQTLLTVISLVIKALRLLPAAASSSSLLHVPLQTTNNSDQGKQRG